MKTTKRRKLAAIMFCDIEGYTALMQADEVHTLQIIKRYQVILDSAAQQFNGKVLKNYSLALFSR
jgi:class 3 adenylate cyclase